MSKMSCRVVTAILCDLENCPHRCEKGQSMCFEHLLEYNGWKFMYNNKIIDNKKHLAQFITCQHDHCGNLINVSRYPQYQKRYTGRISQILKMNFELILMCNAYHGFYKTGTFDVDNPCKCSICIEHAKESKKFHKEFEMKWTETQIMHQLNNPF